MSIIIYGSTLSPYVRKTMAFAAEKGADVELKMAYGAQGDPDHLECSPFRKIPSMRHGDFTLCDSTAIIAYLDAIKPDPVLIPHEAKARATTIWFEEFGDTILAAAAGKLFFNRIVAPKFLGREGDLAAADKAQAEELPPIFDYIEKVLPASGHLVGDTLTLADLAVASPFANLLHLDVSVDAKKYPKLAGFVERMLARPSFAKNIALEKTFLGAA